MNEVSKSLSLISVAYQNEQNESEINNKNELCLEILLIQTQKMKQRIERSTETQK